jgi:hypothetical protein
MLSGLTFDEVVIPCRDDDVVGSRCACHIRWAVVRIAAVVHRAVMRVGIAGKRRGDQRTGEKEAAHAGRSRVIRIDFSRALAEAFRKGPRALA